MKKIILIAILLASCNGFEQKTEVGDNSSATVNQQQDKTQGAKVQTSSVEDVITNNTDGIPVYWFMIGALVAGIIIPQPKWMRVLW